MSSEEKTRREFCRQLAALLAVATAEERRRINQARRDRRLREAAERLGPIRRSSR